MQDVIFREYDIRGKVGSELIVEHVYDLARAIACYFVQNNPMVKTVALGMDGRTHSQHIKDLVVKGFNESGLDVIFIGVCPTPVLYFALYTLPVDAGIMITASHNPQEYNGMKICLGKEVVWGKKIQEIKELYKARTCVVGSSQGLYYEQAMISSYITMLAEQFKHLYNMPLSAVIDCGNGAAGTVLPELIQTMGWQQVQLLYPEVDGTYPNHEADPTVEKNMQEVKRILANTDTQIGLGLDGDCDRMAPMTKAGFLVPGDQLLAIFAQKVLLEHPGVAVVFDVKSSAALIQVLESLGAQPCMSPAGHSIIKDQMKLHHALLGGELSCHFFFKDRYFGYDDGIYAALRLFEIVLESGKSLEQLLAIVPKKYSSPEYRMACPDNKKHEVVSGVTAYFMQRPDVKTITIDGVRATLPDGWGIVRVSNTQPALTIRFESDSEQGLHKVKQEFYAVLKKYFDPTWLQEQLAI